MIKNYCNNKKMGCCETSNRNGSLKSILPQKIKEAIDNNSTKEVLLLLNLINKKKSEGKGLMIDREIIFFSGINLNPLGYCLVRGKTSVFKFLHEKGASIPLMEELLEKNNLRAINIICHKGYKDLLEYYLPIYLNSYKLNLTDFNSFTVDFQDTQLNNNRQDLPIHTACRADRVGIVYYLYKYFQNKPCPREFDIKAQNEYLGEDAGLVSCRVGSSGLIKMLHELCGIDFKTINKNKENAIMVCMSGYKASASYNYIECVVYLVEVVKVDITYMYEETLCLAEGYEMVNYIESQLEKVNIFTKKKDLDQTRILFEPAVDKPDNSCGDIFTEDVR